MQRGKENLSSGWLLLVVVLCFEISGVSILGLEGCFVRGGVYVAPAVACGRIEGGRNKYFKLQNCCSLKSN